METCQGCGFNEEDCMCETTNEADDAMPSDYEACGDCGFDHGYEYEEATKWHEENPGSYRGLGIEENDEFGDFEVCDPLEDTCGEPLKFDDLRHSSDPASDVTRFKDEAVLPFEDELEDIEMGELEVQDALERKNRQLDVDESDELDEDGAVGYVATGYNESDELDEATKKPNFYKRIKLAYENGDLKVYPDEIGRDKEGNVVFRKGFFYRHGGNEEKFTNDVSNALTAAGIEHVVVDKGEKYANFKGGQSVKAGSHWWVKVHEPMDVETPTSGVVTDIEECFAHHMDAIVLRESRQVEKQPDSPYRRLAISRKDPLGRIVMR